MLDEKILEGDLVAIVAKEMQITRAQLDTTAVFPPLLPQRRRGAG
jgi:hypothetical protein